MCMFFLKQINQDFQFVFKEDSITVITTQKILPNYVCEAVINGYLERINLDSVSKSSIEKAFTPLQSSSIIPLNFKIIPKFCHVFETDFTIGIILEKKIETSQLNVPSFFNLPTDEEVKSRNPKNFLEFPIRSLATQINNDSLLKKEIQKEPEKKIAEK
jgi:hypothetical protein